MGRAKPDSSLNLRAACSNPVVGVVIVVVGEGVEAGHALNIEGGTGAGVVGVHVNGGLDGEALADGGCDVGAVEGRGDREGLLLTRGEGNDLVDDAADRSAAVGVGYAAGRDDVDIDPKRLGVTTLVTDLDDDVLDIRGTVAEDYFARSRDLLSPAIANAYARCRRPGGSRCGR